MSEIDFESLRADMKRRGIKAGRGEPKAAQLGGKRKKGSYGYTCTHCGKFFQHLWQLGAHMRHVYCQGRRKAAEYHQLSPIPTNIPKHHKDLRVQKCGQNTRIASTYFIPKDWRYIRIHEPVPQGNSLWVLFEPLHIEKS